MRVSSKSFGLLVLVLVFALAALPIFAQTGTATPTPAPAGTVGSGDAIALAIGDSVEGELTNENPFVAYTLTVEEETTFAATLSSEDFDCYLVLIDESGVEVAYDDDSAGSLDSRLTYTAAPGTYTLVAESYSYRNSSSAAVGPFTLTVREQQINRIEYSQTVEGELTQDSLAVRYVFTGSAGDVIVAQHLSDAYDSYLTLEYNGSQLMSDDDSAGNLDSRIGPYTLPSTGQYTLVVSSLSGSNTGAYTVTLDRVELESITIGEPTTVEFAPNRSTLFFQFDGQIGDSISVSVDADVDTNLSINDPSNYSIITDEDSGAGRNPEVTELSLSSQGVYTLVLRSVDGEAGSATVTITRAAIPSLNDGPVTLRFSSSVYNRTVGFTPESGTTYRLTLDLTSGSQGSPSVDMTQNGYSLGYTSASYVQRLSFDFTPTSTENIIIRLTDYSYSNLSYRLSIEPVER